MKSKSFFLIFVLNIILTLSSFGQIVRYTTDRLNVRRGPSIGYASLGTIPAGTEVTIYDYDYNEKEWLQVVYNGQTGYISTKYLSSQKVLTARVNTSNNTWTTSSSSSYNSHNGYYRNCDGNWIPRPQYSNTQPSGATAICRDGTYSFSAHRRGTCSHHGGVKVWLN